MNQSEVGTSTTRQVTKTSVGFLLANSTRQICLFDLLKWIPFVNGKFCIHYKENVHIELGNGSSCAVPVIGTIKSTLRFSL